MNMLSVLNESQSLRLDEAIDAFEEACEREGHADLSRFVPEPGHPAYLAVLGELIRVDLERSWNQGQGKRLEEYRVAFPELFQDQKSLRAIAFEEYRVR